MKKNLRYFMTLLLMMVASVGWAEDVTIATATFNGKNAIYTEGWTTTGTGLGRTDCVIIGKDENITSPAFDLTGYSSVTITFTARRYGSLTGSKATVDAAIAGNSVGTIDITKSSVGTVDGNITFTPTSEMTAASLVFTCTNATSAGSTHGAGIGSITIKGEKKAIVDPNKEDAELSYDNTVYTIHMGDAFTAPILNNPHSLTVSYVSDNNDVAEVTPTSGTVTVKGVGTAKITASSEANDDYNAGEASYTLTVKQAIEDGVFNFTIDEDYGSGYKYGSVSVQSGTWTAVNVTMTTAGRNCWYNSPNFRLYAADGDNAAGTMTFAVPAGNVITAIAFEGKDLDKITPDFGDYSNGIWSGSQATVTFTANGTSQITKITVTYGEGTPKQNPELAFSSTTATANVGVAFTAPTLSYAEGFDGTITYSSSNTDVATVDATGDVTILAVGETTITATFAGDDTYEEGSASYTLTVIDPNAPGASADNPYTVAQVLDLFENGEVPTSEVYVKGTISNIKSLDVSKYKRAQYYISDDGTTENQFYVYNGYYLDGADFTANDQIKVGDKVVICGKLTTYSGTNEFAADNYIVSLEHVGKAPAELSYATASVTKYVGDADFTNALINNHNLSISYSSSEPTVATVDENGLVSILAAGTTIITATSEETEEYEAGEASYTLEVKESTSLVTVDADGNITFDLTDNAWGFPTTGTNQAEASFSNSGYTIKVAAATNYKYYDSGYFLLGKENSYLTLPAFDFDVEKIEVVGRSGASGSVVQNIFVGETAVSTATTGATGTNSYEIDADYQAAGNIYTLKVTSAHNTQITFIKVYKKQATATESVPVNQHGKGTYVTTNALDFTGITTVTAYVATAQNGSDVTFDPVTKVPAGTPLLVKGATTDVPVIASAEEIGTNFLVAGSGEGVASVAGGKYNFILNYLNNAVGFYRAAGMTVAADRAYLSLDSDIPAGSAKVNLIFSDEESTGINNVNAVENTNEKVFNLAGQQMKSAVKGVYIKNGKKYVK